MFIHKTPPTLNSSSASGDIFNIIDRNHNREISESEFLDALSGGIIKSPLRNFDGSENRPPMKTESYAKTTKLSSKKDVTRVTCLGDSITDGACGSDTMSYPEQLQNLLGDAYEVSKYAAYGRGVLESAYFPIWNEEELLSEATASNPDIVVIMFGTNDAKITGFSESEFRTEYDRLLKMFSELSSHPTLYILTPPPVYDAGLEDHSVIAPNVNEKMVPILTDIAANHGVKLIDVFAAYKSKCPDLNGISCDLIAHVDPPPEEGVVCENDYIHPSDAGYTLIAELVAKGIA